MNKIGGKILCFAIGAVSASVVTWFITKKKYETIMNEESESIKEAREKYANLSKELSEKNIKEKEKINMTSPIINSLKTQSNEELIKTVDSQIKDILEETDKEDTLIALDELSYDYASSEKKDIYEQLPVDEKKDDGPYVIPPDEFGEIDGYACVSLRYFSDGVVTDDFDEIVTNPEKLIGPEALNTYGLYDDYTVFVRDDENETDYEIILEDKTYDEYYSTN